MTSDVELIARINAVLNGNRSQPDLQSMIAEIGDAINEYRTEVSVGYTTGDGPLVLSDEISAAVTFMQMVEGQRKERAKFWREYVGIDAALPEWAVKEDVVSRGEYEIAQQRGDAFRAKFNEDTTKLAKLREENERLRAALTGLVRELTMETKGGVIEFEQVYEAAREALADSGGEE